MSIIAPSLGICAMTQADASPEIVTLAKRLRLLLPSLLATQRSSWEQGTATHALLDCEYFYSALELPVEAHPYDFVRYIYALAHESLVRQSSDGRLAVLLNGDGTSDLGLADPASNGEGLYFLLSREEQTGNTFPSPRSAASTSLADGADKMLRCIVDQHSGHLSEDQHQLISHRIDCSQIWSDTVYMLPPFLVSAALFHLGQSHPRYSAQSLLRVGLQQIILAAEALQAPSGEWSHIYDLAQGAFQRKAFWGVGNGWVCAGITRILFMLVRESIAHTHAVVSNAVLGLFKRERALGDQLRQCLDILVRTVAACLRHMRPDGLFHDILDDDKTFVETNFAQQLAYTLYRLLDLHAHAPQALAPYVDFGELPVAGWEQLAEKMRLAAVENTDKWGFVRDVCGSPRFAAPGTAAEGQAWAIMMEVARAQYLLNNRGPVYVAI